jgi:phosphatidylserine decarboxylase
MSATWKSRVALAALRALPRNAVSRLAGRAAGWRLPGPLQRLEIRAFARAVGVDWNEVRDPIESFPTLQAFFTRRLKEGARPVHPAPDALVAPCDGFWGAAGIVERGTLMQLKGRPYSLAALLGDGAEAAPFEGGPFATFYLSPRDYHRFHTPCAGRIVRASHLPGTLWPVNRLGVEGVPGLFAENERLCAYFRVRPLDEGGTICLVAIGATLVGKVRVEFDDLATDAPGAAIETRTYPEPGPGFEKGQEWGRFEFGSTLVLIATPGLLRIDACPPGSALRLGERIGTLL